MKQELIPLPIDPYIDNIVKDCQIYPSILIKASPGSGKTTRLPWSIAQKLPGKVLVLEPRRLAAKLAAERIASENNLKVGNEIGYHFRMEKVLSNQTKLIFHTEGTFLKKLIDDPELSGVSAVILDEVHERHLDTDLSLAYLRALQKRRPDLKLILMSATLDTSLQAHFTSAKLWEISAKHYDVEIRYLPNQPSILNQTIEQKVNNALKECLSTKGDILVFLPGMREMEKVRLAIGENYGRVFILHGDISKDEQSHALGPNSSRKIILATNIAESSLTIPGVRIVIDSGIQREANYSAWNGLKFLQDKKTTQSSAIQRTGRAGREDHGLCLRLFSEQDFREREVSTEPEILRADLTDTYLLGKKLKSEFDWLLPPPEAKWESATKLAERLGAIEGEKLSPIGERMFSYPVDARLARMLVAGENLQLSEKKKLLNYICHEIEEDRSGNLFRRLQHFLKEGNETSPFEKCILSGFIDQVALFRPRHHDFIHYSGKSFKSHPSLHNLEEGFYVVLDITQRQEVIKTLAVDEDWFYDMTPFPLEEQTEIDLIGESFKSVSQVKLGSLVVESENKNLRWEDLNSTNKIKVFKIGQKILDEQLKNFKESEKFGRLAFWAKNKNLPLDKIDEKMTFENYVESFQTLKIDSLTKYINEEIKNNLAATTLQTDLPLSLNLGGRNPLIIHYSLYEDPYIEAPIQDFYGQTTTPAVWNGKIPLTIKLVGPHKRPIQVTKDLKGFWEKTYKELKKEYQREYPRHHWPEDPLTAKPVLLKRML